MLGRPKHATGGGGVGEQLRGGVEQEESSGLRHLSLPFILARAHVVPYRGSSGWDAVGTIFIHDPRSDARGMAANQGFRDCMHCDIGVMCLSPFKQP